MWVAVGDGTNTILYSTNGTRWTAPAPESDTFSNQGKAVAWNGSIWVAVGNDNYTILYSTYGTSWAAATGTTFSTGGFALTWNGSRWVAVGYNTDTILYSTDGINWTAPSSGITFSNGGEGVASKFVTSDAALQAIFLDYYRRYGLI
jgi:DNA-binding transcriptional regulator of glucitol operon